MFLDFGAEPKCALIFTSCVYIFIKDTGFWHVLIRVIYSCTYTILLNTEFKESDCFVSCSMKCVWNILYDETHMFRKMF